MPPEESLTGSAASMCLALSVGRNDGKYSGEHGAIFYNPAMSDRLRGASLGVQWAGSASTLYTLSAATDWWGGAIGVGVMGLDYHAPLAGDAVLLPGDFEDRPTIEQLLSEAGGRKVGTHVPARGDKLQLVELASQAPSVHNTQPWIFHLAAQSYVSSSFQAPADTLHTNVIGTTNLLDGFPDRIPYLINWCVGRVQ